MTSHVLSGLMTRRSEIAERIAEKRAEVRDLMNTLEHLDATIREFKPDADLENVDTKGPRPETWAGRGEALKEILNILRLADRPMSVADIGKEVMQQRGISRKDKRMVRIVNKRVSATLRAQRDQGRVNSVTAGQQVLWEVNHE
jgi:hypothetical protein